MKHFKVHSLPLLVCLLGAASCNDTSDALSERASEERAQMQEEIKKLKADLSIAKQQIKDDAAELGRRAEEASERGEDAAREAAHDGKAAVVDAGQSVTKTIDKADKALAEKIRDDD